MRTPDEHARRPAEATLVPAPGDIAMAAKIFAFGAMCVGFFIALLDIQIVSASLKEIGGGLSASPDEIAWVQTSYLIAEIIVIPLSGWMSRVYVHTLAVLPSRPSVSPRPACSAAGRGTSTA